MLLSVPTVGIRAATSSTTEGGGVARPAAIVIERSGGDLTLPLAVSFTLGGTASADDYLPVATNVVIPAKVKSLRVSIVSVDDALAEDVERVVVTLSPAESYAIASNRTAATIAINDNEPIISITRSKDAAEGKTTATPGAFTVKRSGKDLSQPLTVEVALLGVSTATETADFAALPRSVTIPAGKSSATFLVTPVQDTREEATETVVMGVASSTGYRIDSKAGAATVKIANTLRIAVDEALGLTAASRRTYALRTDATLDGERQLASGTASITTTREGERGELSVEVTSTTNGSLSTVVERLAIERRPDGAYLTSLDGDFDFGGTGLPRWDTESLRLSPSTLTSSFSSRQSLSYTEGDASITGTVSLDVRPAASTRIITPAGTFNARSLTVNVKAKGSGQVAQEGGTTRFTYDLTFSLAFFFTDDAGLVRSTQSLDAKVTAQGDTSTAKVRSTLDLMSLG